MAVLEALIVASCVGLSGNVHDACLKSLDAGSKQSGVEQDVNKMEDNVNKKADKAARSLIGNDGMAVGASLGFVAKAAVEKSASFKFPVFVPSMYINTQIGAEKSMLGIEWKY